MWPNKICWNNCVYPRSLRPPCLLPYHFFLVLVFVVEFFFFARFFLANFILPPSSRGRSRLPLCRRREFLQFRRFVLLIDWLIGFTLTADWSNSARGYKAEISVLWTTKCCQVAVLVCEVLGDLIYSDIGTQLENRAASTEVGCAKELNASTLREKHVLTLPHSTVESALPVFSWTEWEASMTKFSSLFNHGSRSVHSSTA